MASTVYETEICFASIKLTRFKLAAGTLMTFAGKIFTEEIERQSRYNVVQKVSFVSKGHDSDKYLPPFWLLPVTTAWP